MDESARAGFADLLPPGHEFPEPDPERWYALIEDGEVSMLMAEEDGELLGFSACGESRDDDAQPPVGEVRRFFVAAGHWGRGVGRALMAAVLDSLRERGCTEGNPVVLRGERAREPLLRDARLHARRSAEDRGGLGAPAGGPLPP